MKNHHYQIHINWTGNKGTGTSKYDEYERSHTIQIANKPTILASSDTVFRGDGTKHNPEDFFITSIAECHMLWYLHHCADAGIIVTHYEDNAKGILSINEKGIGKISEVTLHPKVIVANESMIAKANQLHQKAHEYCFMANSVNFEVKIECEADV